MVPSVCLHPTQISVEETGSKEGKEPLLAMCTGGEEGDGEAVKALEYGTPPPRTLPLQPASYGSTFLPPSASAGWSPCGGKENGGYSRRPAALPEFPDPAKSDGHLYDDAVGDWHSRASDEITWSNPKGASGDHPLHHISSVPSQLLQNTFHSAAMQHQQQQLPIAPTHTTGITGVVLDPTSLAPLECRYHHPADSNPLAMAYLSPVNSFQNHSYFGDPCSTINVPELHVVHHQHERHPHVRSPHQPAAGIPADPHGSGMVMTSFGFPVHHPWHPTQGSLAMATRQHPGSLRVPAASAGELDLLELVAG